MKPAMNTHQARLMRDTAGRESLDASGIPAAFRRLADLMDTYPLELAQSPKELEAIAWMRQTLEDLEVTVICLGQSSLPPLLDERLHRSRLKSV